MTEALVFALIVSLGIITLALIAMYFDHREWKAERRRKRKDYFDKKSALIWRPSYWSKSEVVRLWNKCALKIRGRFSMVIMPITKGIKLGIQSITVTREVFREIGPASDYTSGTHLTQVYCKSCSTQRLGIWMERRPDSSTGEVLSNKPFKAVCLDCLTKIPKEKRALYSITWTEQYDPFESRDEDGEYYEPLIGGNSGVSGGAGPIGPEGPPDIGMSSADPFPPQYSAPVFNLAPEMPGYYVSEEENGDR